MNTDTTEAQMASLYARLRAALDRFDRFEETELPRLRKTHTPAQIIEVVDGLIDAFLSDEDSVAVYDPHGTEMRADGTIHTSLTVTPYCNIDIIPIELSVGVKPLSPIEQAFLVLRAKVLEDNQQALVDGLLLQPLWEKIGKERFEELISRTDEVLTQKVKLPDQGSFADHAYVHLKTPRGSDLKTIYYCGGAHSESDPPPSTYYSKHATCPQCLLKHQQRKTR